jgi:hypothetical protein
MIRCAVDRETFTVHEGPSAAGKPLMDQDRSIRTEVRNASYAAVSKKSRSGSALAVANSDCPR